MVQWGVRGVHTCVARWEENAAGGIQWCAPVHGELPRAVLWAVVLRLKGSPVSMSNIEFTLSTGRRQQLDGHESVSFSVAGLCMPVFCP
jgi:hypothetical protein